MPFIKDKIAIELEEAELSAVKTYEGFSSGIKKSLIILAVALIPSFFIVQQVSQVYWLGKYQNKLFAAKPSFTQPLQLEISKVSLTKEKEGYYSAFVKIENPNFELSLNNINYKFTFYNSLNEVVYSSNDKLFLLPNENKYITAPRFLPLQPIDHASFEITQELPWQKRLSIPKVNLVASKPNAYQQSQPSNFVLEGQFTNNSPYALKQAKLTFVLYGPSGQIISVTQRNEFGLKPQERRAYKQLWPNLTTFNVDRFEVFTETNVLDPNNLTAPANTQAVPTTSSDLSRPSPNK